MWQGYTALSRDGAKRCTCQGLTRRSGASILEAMNRAHAKPVPRALGLRTCWPVAATVFLAACSSSVEPLLTRWEGELAPVSPGNVFGQVAAVSQFGRTQVSILIQVVETGASFGWRIDSGSCQEAGTIQGGPGQYPPLAPGEDSTAGAEAVLASVFREENHYAARVFRITENGGEQIVACGNLRLVR